MTLSNRKHCLILQVLLALITIVPATAGRLHEVMQNGPFPHLQGMTLHLERGPVTAGAWSEPAVTDWDNDGKLDLLVGSGYGDLLYFHRLPGGELAEPVQMLPDALSFTPALNGLSPVIPTVADWDADGDIDLLLGMRGRIFLCRREGDALSPAEELGCTTGLAGAMIRSISTNAGTLAPSVADLDGDGDFDLLVGDDLGQIWWIENRGTSKRAALADPRRLTAGSQPISVGGRARVTVGDWNRDGFQDLIIGTASGTVYLAPGSPQGLGTPVPRFGPGVSGVIDSGQFLTDITPVYCRWKQDEPQLILGSRNGGITTINPLNSDGMTAGAPLESLNVPLDLGRCAVACAVDIDGDKDLDIIAGGEDGGVWLFECLRINPYVFKTGRALTDTAGTPLRAKCHANALPSLRYAWPMMVDLDADDDYDLLLGQANGTVAIWENTGNLKFSGGQPVAVSGNALVMSGATTVSALDYDGDGDIDLFIGNRMLPGAPPTLGLTSEAVLYLESTWQRPAKKRGRMPLYVKAVRMDAFLVSEDPQRPVRDAEMLGLSCLQPVQWKRSGNLQFLAGTRHGIYLFNNLLERRAYPRLELRAPVDGLPLPLIPPVWSAVACRLIGTEIGILCGLEQTGWIVWYPGTALPGL